MMGLDKRRPEHGLDLLSVISDPNDVIDNACVPPFSEQPMAASSNVYYHSLEGTKVEMLPSAPPAPAEIRAAIAKVEGIFLALGTASEEDIKKGTKELFIRLGAESGGIEVRKEEMSHGTTGFVLLTDRQMHRERVSNIRREL